MSLYTNPPTTSAVVTLAMAMAPVAFQPKSRNSMVMVDRQGMNNMLTSASIMNCTGVSTAARLVPNNATSISKVYSFLTAPNMRTTPANTGNPNQKTVIGARKFAIGVRNPSAYKACIRALAII